jgi:hypothetical protein
LNSHTTSAARWSKPGWHWLYMVGAAVLTAIAQRILVVLHLGIAYWPIGLVLEILLGIAFAFVSVCVTVLLRQALSHGRISKWLPDLAGSALFGVLWLAYDFTFNPGVLTRVFTAVLGFVLVMVAFTVSAPRRSR